MRYSYKTKDTCSTEISFDIKDGKVFNIQFAGGCDGNLKAISTILEGWSVEEVIKKVNGITCGQRPTSCTDQLARALAQAAES